MNNKGIKTTVISLLEDVCEDSCISFEKNENLYEEGILDSVKIMDLVIRLEDAFEIEFWGEELLFDNFASLDCICNTIAQKLDGGLVVEQAR